MDAPEQPAAPSAHGDLESVVRARLRGMRVSYGWSLDELASRTHLSASTISRLETGKRTLSLDLLQPLCAALQVDLSTLLDVTSDDDDVVIRPVETAAHGLTSWPLTRNHGPNGVVAAKFRIETRPEDIDLDERRVHPGHDWFFVLSGTVLLLLGDRRIEVQAGEAAEFSTMTPHAFVSIGGPAELITIFDRDGQHAHLSGSAGSNGQAESTAPQTDSTSKN
ncbi:MAG: helix-turn-helix domain-containing protein [Actinomycetota bacterium]|nr:helix-turn-helix domain-containing protein [Actinomycetota bacterium]